MKRTVTWIVLLILIAGASGGVASLVLTARSTSEYLQAVSMQALASTVASDLLHDFRRRRSFPETLDQYQARDTNLFTDLHLTQADLNSLHYSTDNQTFHIRWESTHFFFNLCYYTNGAMIGERLTSR